MGMIVGLDAATARKAVIVGSLLIIGIADNLTDALSVHIYQESEKLAEKRAFRTTVANFIARFAISISFILIFLLLPTAPAIAACIVWGFLLLSGLSYFLAKARAVSAFKEISKHAGVALVVLVLSQIIGIEIRGVMASF